MTWRTATPDDAVALRDLEREANLVGLAHVFGELPFPDDGVLARWRDTLTGRIPVLWVLAANHRARGLYDHLGWEPTGREQPAEWAPYPTELEYRLPESAHGL